jgi:hypothetical protein
MTLTDVFNAVVGYYLIVLAVSAGAGIRAQLRDPAASAQVAAGGTTAIGGATAASDSTRTRFGALIHGRTLHAAHRFGWATGVGAALGWLAGAEFYRAGRRGTIAAARRAQDWRGRRRAGAVGDAPETDADTGTQRPQAADGPDVPQQTAPDATPDPAVTLGPDTPPQGAPQSPAAITGRPGDGPVPAAKRHPWLQLVPPLQEYPDTMPAVDITDLESLVVFTDQTAGVAGMEAEDASAASASMIAGAEFAGHTALRVNDETASLEMAVAAMAMLRVDADSQAAYHDLLEAGALYRDQTAAFSAQCHDAATTAGQMAAAAVNYHETAQHALAVLSSHQMPHAEAAMATGHSGAHGAFYGVADTGGQDALPGAGVPQLPAS